MSDQCLHCACDCTGRVARRSPAGVVCERCYTRDYCTVACTQCGGVTRSYHGRPALCPSCGPRLKCAECGAVVNGASAITVSGDRICNRCSARRSAPRTCSKCGLISRHLLAGIKNAGLPICKRCMHPDRYGNCCLCRKQRLIASYRSDGKPICATCTASPCFVCPVCGQEGARHSRAMCLNCYHRARTAKAAAEAASQTNAGPWRSAVENFFKEWMDTTKGGPTAIKHLWRHHDFFCKLAAKAAEPESLTLPLVFDVFSPNQLQGAFVPVSWMIRQGYLAFLTPEALLEESARREQLGILERAGETWRRAVLTRYLSHLHRRQAAWRRRGWENEDARFLPRTMTLLLRAAHEFLLSLGPETHGPQAISQLDLDRFVLSVPGQRSSLITFVKYLRSNEHLFTPLKLSVGERVSPPLHLILSSQRSAELLDQWLHTPGLQIRNCLLGAFMLLYARSATQACKLRKGDFTFSQNGVVTARFGAVPIELDEVTAHLLSTHIQERENSLRRPMLTEDYIFPGRIEGHHLNRSTLGNLLHRNDVTARQLFATAVTEHYRKGLSIPKVLVKALGINIVTAIQYREALAPDLSAEARYRETRS